MTSLTTCARFAAAVALFTLAGCGASVDHLSGNVTYKGKPIPYGKITFQPDASQGNSGPLVEAEIIDGKYDTSKGGGKGVSRGALVVSIQGYQGAPGIVPEMKKGAPRKPPPPPKQPKIDKETGEIDPTSLYGEELFGKYQTKLEIPSGTDTKDFEVPE